jgi:NADH pyrophosphatase NudC (nudix superfamily)
MTALTDAINMDRTEVLDCKWIKLDDALTVKNPILQRVAQQLIFGLKNGFEQSIDFSFEKIPSIVTGLTFDFFTRSIRSNK